MYIIFVKIVKIKKYKKIRLKELINIERIFLFILYLICGFSCVLCNRPPKFIIEGQSEIVLRLKETPETPVGTLIYHLRGYDPDNDPLTFGILRSPDSDVIRIKKSGKFEADVYLNKELDRETKDEYSIILTLTDNNFGDESYITQSMLLLVDDINDNEPIFKPYQTAIEVPENSRPGVITNLEATDRDEGAYGQVVYYLQELEGDNDVFSISTYKGKGILSLVTNLDYEKKSLYQLRVLAIDRANQGRVNTGTAAILIKVKDIEDQPPEFVQVQSIIRVSEDISPGSEILHVKAIDGDRGVNNKIRYSIENSNNLFMMDSNSGVLYTTTHLDRENTTNQVNGAYILKITATEISKINPPPFVKTEITIVLTDVNDEIPTFRERFYRCEIDENSQLNTPLNFLDDSRNEVFDYDLGNNGTFKLFIHPPSELFEIVPETVVNEANFLIRVKNSSLLDYERIKEINFTIIAKDMEDPQKWSMANIFVFIRDRNDNFPEFTTSIYEVLIPENCEAGTTILRIEAIDQDSGDYGTIGLRYINLSGSIAHLLHLDSISGVITMESYGGNALDREIISRHYLTVEARDNNGNGNRNTAQLIINIEDVNDNAPIFLQRKYEAKLLENKIHFETPLILEARDIDLNGTKNSEITFDIIEGILKNNFTIDSKKGILTPRSFIDFEELPTSENPYSNIRNIHLIVRAKDSGVPSLSSRVPVIIYVQDVNDNSPVFQVKSYSKIIPEDLPGGSKILEVKAFDKDGSPPNNNIVYRIQKGASDKFVIDSDDGIIYVAQGASLDPDLRNPKKKHYSLSVMALDGGLGSTQLTSMVTVNISIKDVNNKIPIFPFDILTLKILENTPVGTKVHKLIATDMDESSILRYYLDEKNSEAKTEEGILVKRNEYDFIGAFELNSLNGVLKTSKLLDREKIENIKLTVIVQDLAASVGVQTATTILNILIEDENDNNPKFKMPFYKRSIAENSMNGITIANIMAYDVDKNKTISYSLEGNVDILNLLHLDSETGELVVANKIDHESFKWLNFSVKATDSGVPPRSSYVDVFVSIIDENDNNPYFLTSTKNFTISENSPIGTRVGVIQAADADSGDFGKITFLMDRISSQGKFSIDADTGVLSVSDKLDREMKDFYMLVIEVWDNFQFGYTTGESRNAFKQIFVNILDENDSPPELIVPQECVQITEYHDPKEVITAIRANDADDPSLPNGQIEFSIKRGNEEGHFYLHQVDPWTVQVFAKNSLKNKYGNFSLTVSARDLGTPSNIVQKHLNICILDFNDHAPVFVSPSHNITIRVPENETTGALIIQVLATDDDIGNNALVRYRLKPDSLGNYKTFQIDEETGKIFLKKQLDREKQKLYKIRVEAYDLGIPTSLSTDLDLTIYVKNVNDYEPQFLIEEIFVNFTEHNDPGVEKVKLPDTIERDEVDDLDDPPSSVCYYVVHGNEKKLFYLNPETHILTTRQELDRELQSKHVLYIRATENCSEIPRNLTSILIRELNHMKEENLNNRKIRNSRYRMYFDRFKHSRSLRSLNDNYENNPKVIEEPEEMQNSQSQTLLSNFDEDLLMTDSTIVKVIIRVLDINDNPPEFKTNIFTGGLTTNADFGVKFMKIEATDPDEGTNAEINYYQIGEIRQTLSEGFENINKAPFLVEEDTGAIQLNFDPQKGMKGYFDFAVLANDTDGLEDKAHVFIYLLREDQKVRFVFRQQPATLRDKIHVFRDTLSNVTDAIVNIDEFRLHENKDGSVDKTKTDIYLHFVDKKDNSIYDVSDVLKLIDERIENLDDLFKEFNVLDTQPAVSQFLLSTMGKNTILVWLIFSNIFITTLLATTMMICATQRRKYKRQLRAAKVNNYNISTCDAISSDPITKVPNTNKHSVEGSNPIWLKAFENEWFSNDENLSEEHDGGGSLGEESIFENDLNIKTTNLFNETSEFERNFNAYQGTNESMNNIQTLAKKLETTEL